MEIILVIDVINTILFHKPPIPMLYSLVLKKYGYIINPTKINNTRRKMLSAKQAIGSKCSCNNAKVTYQKKWIRIIDSILKECGVYTDMNYEIAQEIHLLINDEKANVVIDRSTISVLEELQSEYNSIGILSNGYSSIRNWLTSLDIDKYFGFILISSEIGHLKPCPLAFKMALKKINKNNMLSIFVGDDLYKDGFGAIYSGFDNAIIVGDSIPDSNILPKNLIYISSLKLLVQTLREVEKYG